MRTARVVERTAATELVHVEMTVNGTPVSVEVPARLTLADLLRERLGLTGTHIGCEHGVCGMCTVLVNGEAVRACLLFACQVDGTDVVTVEGLGTPDDLHPLQEAFGRHHALQCGFCTPGFLMSSYDLLAHEPEVRRESLPAELSGVICRCTGYRNILDAVEDVATSCDGEVTAPKNCAPRTLLGRGAGMPLAMPDDQTQAAQSRGAEEHPDEIRLPQGDPTMNVEVTSTLAAPPADVSGVFDDLFLLIRCLPGAELTEDLGEGWYRGRASVALGPIRLKFDGVAHVLVHERDELRVLAQGKDTSGGGAQADIRLQATPVDDGTELQARARVFLTGRVAGFGRSLAGDVSRRMFQEFAEAVGRAAAGGPVEPTQPPSAVRMVLDALRERWRRRRRRRHQGGPS
jgi:aerobic-type carbon monoxide dehydrogenase small subunit (CoxS/CutS family)/carbon monoxide dehydrogenase subunit G